MTATMRTWAIPKPIVGDAWRGLHPDPVVADLLWRRGLRDADAVADFLDATAQSPDDLLIQGVKLPNFDAAVARGVRAVREGERVGVFGDYDADGTTAAAMLALFFGEAVGAGQVLTRLPTRETGYGLCEPDVRALAEHGGAGGLLIVADTGSSDHDCVPLARELGLEVVILDHHQIGEHGAGPDGAITVSAYLTPAVTPRDPLRDLTGAGLGWLYLLAIADELGDSRLQRLATGLQDLAMLGTVADVAPLTGLNRPLVRDGLRAVRTQPRPGVAALCAAGGVEPTTLTAHEASMKLAPRLNAAGRMGDPMLALRLLMATDVDEATRLARQLENRNTGRKVAMNQVIEQATTALRARIGTPGGLSSGVLIAHGAGWHPGVIGPAASRIVDTFNKPVILLSDDPNEPGVSRGSARSIPGFDIAGALRSAATQALLIRHGGHSAAAGVTLATDRIERLAATLEAELDQVLAGSPDLRAVLGRDELIPDAELSADRLTLATARSIAQLGPFGQGNENPLFLVRNVPLQRRTLMGKDPQRQHLKLVVGLPGQAPAEVILWGGGERLADAAAARSVDLAVRIGINRWNGQTKLEAIAEDFRLAR
jgi:single-stranded-DNA-specific exonuclease